MTNVIFFNKIRGSGREVTINLIDSGIEIMSSTGEHIAIWAYPVVDLVKESSVPREGSFFVDHDPIHFLQIFDEALWDQVIERTPRARKTERKMTAFWWQIWEGIPDQAIAGVLIAITLGTFWGGRQMYLWLFSS